MEELSNRVFALEGRMSAAETHIRATEHIVNVLKDDVADIKGRIAYLATKDDIREMEGKIDGSINGLLRDALAAVPGRQAAVWATVSAVAVIIGLALTLFHIKMN